MHGPSEIKKIEAELLRCRSELVGLKAKKTMLRADVTEQDGEGGVQRYRYPVVGVEEWFPIGSGDMDDDFISIVKQYVEDRIGSVQSGSCFESFVESTYASYNEKGISDTSISEAIFKEAFSYSPVEFQRRLFLHAMELGDAGRLASFLASFHNYQNYLDKLCKSKLETDLRTLPSGMRNNPISAISICISHITCKTDGTSPSKLFAAFVHEMDQEQFDAYLEMSINVQYYRYFVDDNYSGALKYAGFVLEMIRKSVTVSKEMFLVWMLHFYPGVGKELRFESKRGMIGNNWHFLDGMFLDIVCAKVPSFTRPGEGCSLNCSTECAFLGLFDQLGISPAVVISAKAGLRSALNQHFQEIGEMKQDDLDSQVRLMIENASTLDEALGRVVRDQCNALKIDGTASFDQEKVAAWIKKCSVGMFLFRIFVRNYIYPTG